MRRHRVVGAGGRWAAGGEGRWARGGAGRRAAGTAGRRAPGAVGRWAAGLAVLAACSSTSEPVDPAPTTLGEQAPSSETVTEAALPMALSGLPILDPGWDQPPKELDGYLLGLDHPDDGEPLRFVAAGEDGELLWEAERPPSCTGFALTRGEDGRPIAVLTDVAPGEEAISQTSASAYDLATGELLWGPVQVPGPHQGPGTVFAEPAPGAAMGETGPRVVLDPDTGEELATEDGDVIIGEYDGVVLRGSGGMVVAEGPETSWEADLGLGAEPIALPGETAPEGTALLGDTSLGASVLVDLATGETLAEGVSEAARDPLSGTLVTRQGEDLVGYPEAGERWEQPADGFEITAAGNVFAYLRAEGAVRAVNVVTGEVAAAFDETTTNPALPVVVTAGGATVVEGADLALVPVPEEP